MNASIYEGKREPFHVMVKTSGAQCNLDCTYCFYLHKQSTLAQPDLPRMSDAVLEAHIRQYIDAQDAKQVVFSWQGGEPTLMGLDFFRKVVALQQQYAKPGQRVENDLQTNGVLIDEEWAKFLKENDFLVGLSMDGPPDLHDLYRRTKGGTPSSGRVVRAAELFHSLGIPFNVLCVVNRTNARRPNDVYRYLRDVIRPRMIQFIPCVERSACQTTAPGHWDANAESAVTNWSVKPEDWGYFLGRVWDEWFRRDYGRVFVDQFENAISQMMGFGAQKCVSSERCGKALAIEHNGDVYSCDHYVYPQYKLGNILLQHEGELANSPTQAEFGAAKNTTLPAYCKACEYLDLCWGDCPKNRFLNTPDGEPGLSYLCTGLKQFYAKVTMARSEVKRRLETSD
jgi:uncharacterized protein